jgi:hypothetical protein
LLRWVRSLFRWIVEPRTFWLCTFVVVASVVVSLSGEISETKIRIIGLFLQLCGIGTVAWGLRETRKLFGYPGFVEHLWEWIKRFPRFKPKPSHSYVNATLPMIKVNSRGHSWQNSAPDATIEERLQAVEANLLNVNQRLIQVHQRIDHETRRITSELSEEQRLREEEDEEIRRKLSLSQTGGLSISAMGLVWLFWGIIMSTASTEIAKWFI